MWNVIIENFLAACGKVSSLTKSDIHSCNFGIISELIKAELPVLLADSALSACMLYGVRFHPIV